MNILDAALAAAWAMEESALAGLLEVAAREHSVTPEALSAYRAGALKKADCATMRDGVAILSVEGPLFKKANLMTELCGATSYATLMRDLQAAVDDADVRAILLNVDSPGGEVSGVGEFADAVKAVRGKKPIVAYAGDLAASAAYWIGSAADRLVIGKGAALGSIGVRITMSDTGERDAKSGVRRFGFVSSQSPYKVSDPSKKDGAARIRARIDALATVFVAAVAENRDVTVTHVLNAFGKGDVLIGEAAIAAGMADSIGSFESTLAALAAEGNPFAGPGLPRAAAKTRALTAAPDAASALLAAFEMAQPRRVQPAAPSRPPGLTPRPAMSPHASGEEVAVQALLEAAWRRL